MYVQLCLSPSGRRKNVAARDVHASGPVTCAIAWRVFGYPTVRIDRRPQPPAWMGAWQTPDPSKRHRSFVRKRRSGRGVTTHETGYPLQRRLVPIPGDPLTAVGTSGRAPVTKRCQPCGPAPASSEQFGAGPAASLPGPPNPPRAISSLRGRRSTARHDLGLPRARHCGAGAKSEGRRPA